MSSPRPVEEIVAGRYAIRRRLGAGSNGVVYLADDQETGRAVALKLIHAERLGADTIRRMQREFRAIAGLRHPQVATAHDFGYTADRVPFYTREFVPGSPLEPGPPDGESPEEYLGPLLRLLDALQHVHEQGILHLDIHPGNVVVPDDDRRSAVLIDFGLVQPAEGPFLATESESRPSLPPEFLESGAVTATTDLYLVGRLLIYRLTGRIDAPPELPREIPGWGTRRTLDLERIAMKAVQASPAQRFQSAVEFREALAAAIGVTTSPVRGSEPRDIFVGRKRELERIEDGLRTASTGGQAVLCLAGRPGSGKTRLLEEARLGAQLRGLDTLLIDFASPSGAEPGLIGALRVRARNHPEERVWLEPLDPRHGGSTRQRSRRAARACLDADEDPIVLLLDNLERADRESREITAALVSECRKSSPGSRRGFALLATSSSTAIEGFDGRSTVRLRPLSRADARRLFQTLLRPFSPPKSVTARAVAEAVGSPRVLRFLARALRLEWRHEGVIPETAEPADLAAPLDEVKAGALRLIDDDDRDVLNALITIGRPATRREIAVALSRADAAVARSLTRLAGLEFVVGTGRPRRFRALFHREHTAAPNALSSPVTRRIHARLATYLASLERPGIQDRENLALHLIASGRKRAGRSAALRVARLLEENSSFDRAVRLLEHASGSTPSVRDGLELIRAMSTILEKTGDHERGIAAIEPFLREGAPPVSARDAIRLRRQLGVHYHRAGHPERALAVFRSAIEIADPRRDVEDLVFIDSELAEIQIFRGDYAAAEEACHRGLEQIGRGALGEQSRGRMEAMLRASLGHIELRRMSPMTARKELLTALRLARKFGTTSDEAAIRHNIAVAANSVNDFAEARRFFRHAERLLARTGDRGNTIQIANNLAIIAAKTGDPEEARAQLEKAAALARRYGSPRHDFAVTYSHGIVHLLTGEVESAIEAFEASLPGGRELGDEYLVRYGEVYLAEALLLSGRYQQARKRLRANIRSAAPREDRLVSRMSESRLALVEALMGNQRTARQRLFSLDETPPTDLHLPEAWNDLFVGLAKLACGDLSTNFFEAPANAFRHMKCAFALRFARIASFAGALLAGDRDRQRAWLADFAESSDTPHPLLDVADALLRAESYFAEGHTETSETWLGRASTAIVGTPFLELDWRIELLRARLALRRADFREARRHLHRSLHARDFLLQGVPDGARKRFLAHPRFAGLEEVRARLQRSPATPLSTRRLWESGRFEGIVGRSRQMVQVFQTIERTRSEEFPVLIRGETGTGKEMVARAIYRRSARRERPFQVLHCAALPEELFESELFGYRAGAFTGAEEDRPGLLERVDGGTILLDDIADLAPGCQAALLRVLETKVIRRLGDDENRPVDVRILASTSQDLEQLVREDRRLVAGGQLVAELGEVRDEDRHEHGLVRGDDEAPVNSPPVLVSLVGGPREGDAVPGRSAFPGDKGREEGRIVAHDDLERLDRVGVRHQDGDLDLVPRRAAELAESHLVGGRGRVRRRVALAVDEGIGVRGRIDSHCRKGRRRPVVTVKEVRDDADRIGHVDRAVVVVVAGVQAGDRAPVEEPAVEHDDVRDRDRPILVDVAAEERVLAPRVPRRQRGADDQQRQPEPAPTHRREPVCSVASHDRSPSF